MPAELLDRNPSSIVVSRGRVFLIHPYHMGMVNKWQSQRMVVVNTCYGPPMVDAWYG